ncbi:MAG TPA: glycosyltransferase family 39 protein [Bryobacteraceae bacterium]|jgi:4-amino-4-deoxy-L-arabinose transferase-like glycosyltransferase|nr:glycosyltransferase family 39 protein [Bryobacteraceae bacterium]
MANTATRVIPDRTATSKKRFRLYLILILIAAAVYLGCIVSPPSLMDDVDAVQAQIARNMLQSRDWVTARLDGVIYLEKSPLIYWAIAGCYQIFGAHDWAARIPVALSAIGLAWLTMAFGCWAFSRRAGFYSGLIIATCVGLFLFTRIQIPDVMQTFTIALSLWALMRVVDPEEPHPRRWAFLLAASLGVGLLLKSLIGVVFPIGAGILYLFFTHQLFSKWTWKRMRPFSGTLIALLIAAPWHILATIRNPPYFDFTMVSLPGQWHGFFWFYFINEQLLRFLNRRYPHDYNTVPLVWFWLFHLIWLFPWSVYFPAVVKLSYRPRGPSDRASKTRVMALCWAGFVMVFFSFSTTQEYYSMPIYPALALLLGSAMDTNGVWIRRGTRFLAVLTACAAVAALAIVTLVWNRPTPGDISVALSSHPAAYTLSLGHMEDLTLASFAYLRLPLILAAIAFTVGAAGNFLYRRRRSFLATAIMMILFFQAARLALIVFDPFMSSRPLANALLHSPKGNLIVDHHYYTFSSVFFYTDRTALLLNGKRQNLVYGASAPGAPDVFIDDAQFAKLWAQPQRWYIVAEDSVRPQLEKLAADHNLNIVATSGGKFLATNHPVAAAPNPLPSVSRQLQACCHMQKG